MPTYDYQCRSCGVITEVVHSMLEDGPTECERCGGALRRVVHPTGIIFRGSGFYKNDSRSSTSGSVSGGSKAEAAASSDGSPATTTSSDAASSKPSTTPTPSVGSGGRGESGTD